VHHQKQPVDHSELINYDNRLIVAGTRGYNDYSFFSDFMHDFVTVYPAGTLVLISGAARTGADDLIIRWCREFNYPWAEFHAAWNDLTVPGAVIRTSRGGKEYNVLAGYDRNGHMAEVGTELLTFWDGKSDGTIDMRKRAKDRYLTVTDVLVDIPKESKYGGKQEGSGEGNP
jgi:hypothetical protein